MGFLRDPIWQFTINIVVGLIGIFITSIVSVAIFRRQQNRKGITYRIISDTPILSLKEEIKGTIQLLFRTKSVSNARLVILKIWNSENTPILPGDFIDPIRLSFGANSEILDAEMLESVPYHLKDKAKSSLKIETESIVLEPILLNSRNSITLKILIAQTPPLTREFNISAHIVGVDHIHNFHRFPPIIVSLARLFTYFSYILFLLLIIYIFLSKYESDGKLKLICIISITRGEKSDQEVAGRE
jgi:hypothetical protein